MRRLVFALLAGLAATSASAADFLMFRNPGCGCCLQWVKHLEAAGHKVMVRDTEAMAAVKERAGIPASAQSCHTAIVDGYVIEGHVPVADIERLLKARPEAVGLAAPGMPMGSPGMEHGDHKQPYDVLLIAKDGSTKVFAHHG